MTALPPAPRAGGTRFARRGSARLAYEAIGGGDPAAPALVLLHDLLDDRSAFAAVRAELMSAAAPGFRLILPDARGHGASAALVDRRVSLGDLGLDVPAILDAEGVDRAHLVGHGLGAVSAYMVAGHAPARVTSLVLVSPTPLAFGAADDAGAREVRAAARAAADAAYKGLTDRALDALLDPRWGAGWRDRLPRPRLAAIRRHAGALAPLLTALAATALDDEELRGVGVPTLVVLPEEAPTLERLVAERVAALLPDARLATIPAPAEPAAPLEGASGAALAARVAGIVADAAP